MELNKKFILNIIVSIFILFIIYGFIKLVSPFIISIFIATIFSVVYYPVYKKLKRKKINETFASFLTVLLVFFTIVLPFSLFFWLLFKEAKIIYPQVVSYIDDGFFSFNIKLPDFIPISSIDLKEIILTNLNEIRSSITKVGIGIIKNIFFFFVNFFIMLISMFFMLKDGENIIKWFVDIIPFENRYIEGILNQFSLTTNAIVRGIILTAFIQGIVAMIGFYLVSFPSPVILGFFTMLSAMIPFLGTSVVTVPVVVYYYLREDILSSIFLLIWGVFIVSLIDNFLRPIFIGRNANIPVALVFLGIVGGLRTYGPIGLFIGPIFVSMLITVLEIYKEGIKKKI